MDACPLEGVEVGGLCTFVHGENSTRFREAPPEDAAWEAGESLGVLVRILMAEGKERCFRDEVVGGLGGRTSGRDMVL